MNKLIMVFALLITSSGFAMQTSPLITKICVIVKNNTNEDYSIRVPNKDKPLKVEPRYKKTIEINYPNTYGFEPLVYIQKDSNPMLKLVLNHNKANFTGHLETSNGIFGNPKIISSDNVSFQNIQNNTLNSEIFLSGENLEESKFKFLK